MELKLSRPCGNFMTDDIIFFQILPRLPAKSVALFKCVSKQWHSFLSTGMFQKMHIHHLTNDSHQKHHKLLVILTKNELTVSWKFYRMDCETPGDVLTNTGRFPLPFNVSLKNVEFLTSFHGMVCVCIDYSHKLILWNPLTGDYKTLSKPEVNLRACVLYYTSCDDDYKLLLVTYSRNVYIYSLKADSWRRIVSKDFESCSDQNPRIPTTFFNEKLYFLSRNSEPKTDAIIRFDTKTETFTEIDIPPPSLGLNYCYPFIVLKGSIHLVRGGSPIDNYCKQYVEIELWRMDGDGDVEWTKVATYWWKLSLDTALPCSPKLLHVLKNGNWLMESDHKGQFCIVDMETCIKDKLCSYTTYSLDDGSHKDSYDKTFVSIQGSYIETCVSPNLYLRHR